MTATQDMAQNSLCVFCGSSPGANPIYIEVAAAVGTAIAQQKQRLVYGGGVKGCMGKVSQSALEAGGRVLGVIPRVMATKKAVGHLAEPQSEISSEGQGRVYVQQHPNLETTVVESMHERKQLMAKQSSAFIALPGGYGTLEEVFEMVTWTQIGVHSLPMVLANVNGFYSPLRTMIDDAVREGFISEGNRKLISFVELPAGASGDEWGPAVLQEVAAMRSRLAGRSGYYDWNKAEGEASSTPAQPPASDGPLAVSVDSLTFSFKPTLPPALQDCTISLARGSRCLLIGANGAGKSTLLRILAGKRLVASEQSVQVFGRDVFRDAPPGVTYLGTEWAMNPVVRSDIVVSHFLDSVGGYRHKERRDRLLDILDVDVDWHMHAISDGERRRVQLCMGLMEPWDLLLLDEVTVDLDVQVRADLLEFLKQETLARNATIIYATHIFDGLQSFPTHLIHMAHGNTPSRDALAWPPSSPPEAPSASATADELLSPLLQLALRWLRADRTEREKRETSSGSKRGARREAETTDSEKFFKQYDYSH